MAGREAMQAAWYMGNSSKKRSENMVSSVILRRDRCGSQAKGWSEIRNFGQHLENPTALPCLALPSHWPNYLSPSWSDGHCLVITTDTVCTCSWWKLIYSFLSHSRTSVQEIHWTFQDHSLFSIFLFVSLFSNLKIRGLHPWGDQAAFPLALPVDGTILQRIYYSPLKPNVINLAASRWAQFMHLQLTQTPYGVFTIKSEWWLHLVQSPLNVP